MGSTGDAEGEEEEGRDDNESMDDAQQIRRVIRLLVEPHLDGMRQAKEHQPKESQPQGTPDGAAQSRAHDQRHAGTHQDQQAAIQQDKGDALGQDANAIEDEAERAAADREDNDERPELEGRQVLSGRRAESGERIGKAGKAREKEQDRDEHEALMDQGSCIDIKQLEQGIDDVGEGKSQAANGDEPKGAG